MPIPICGIAPGHVGIPTIFTSCCARLAIFYASFPLQFYDEIISNL